MNLRSRLAGAERSARQLPVPEPEPDFEERRRRLRNIWDRAAAGDEDARRRLERLRELAERIRHRREGRPEP
jgi:hypothetical protein